MWHRYRIWTYGRHDTVFLPTHHSPNYLNTPDTFLVESGRERVCTAWKLTNLSAVRLPEWPSLLSSTNSALYDSFERVKFVLKEAAVAGSLVAELFARFLCRFVRVVCVCVCVVWQFLKCAMWLQNGFMVDRTSYQLRISTYGISVHLTSVWDRKKVGSQKNGLLGLTPLTSDPSSVE